MSRFLTALGVVMLVAAALLAGNNFSFLSKASRAEGTIVSYDSETSTDSDGKSHTTNYPVIEFRTETGEVVRFRGEMGTSGRGRTGRNVGVAYDPFNPAHARTTGLFGMWFGALAVGVIGIFVTWGGISMLLYERRLRIAQAIREEDAKR